jgi:hypothetical protein
VAGLRPASRFVFVRKPGVLLKTDPDRTTELIGSKKKLDAIPATLISRPVCTPVTTRPV